MLLYTLMKDKIKKIYDMIIIGGGPIGMFAAYYAGLRTLKVQLIESLGKLGGQLEALYPEKEMINVPGFAKVKAADFIKLLNQQLNNYPVDIKLNHTVENVKKLDDVFQIKTNNELFYGKTIMIATGIGPFTPRKLPFDVGQEVENKFISYYVKNPKKYKDLNVTIAGGGDGAIDIALELLDYAKNITIIHRRDNFRALESNMVKVYNSPIVLETPYLIKSIDYNSKNSSITIEKVHESDKKKTIVTDHLIVSYGFKANNRLQQNWNIELQRNLVKVDQKMESTCPGIFAIGDANIYPYKQKILANGFGEVPIAINNAISEYSLTANRNIHGVIQ